MILIAFLFYFHDYKSKFANSNGYNSENMNSLPLVGKAKVRLGYLGFIFENYKQTAEKAK